MTCEETLCGNAKNAIIKTRLQTKIAGAAAPPTKLLLMFRRTAQQEPVTLVPTATAQKSSLTFGFLTAMGTITTALFPYELIETLMP